MKPVLTSLAAGFAALGVVMTGFITGVLGQNLRDLVLLVGVLFFIAGLLRGVSRPFGPWMNGLVVALGGVVPVCIMAVTSFAFTSMPHLFFFIAAALASAISGALARTYWNLSQRPAGAAIAILWAAVVVLTAQLCVPAVLERIWTERVNYAAPAFVFTSSTQARITNASLRGRVTVLAFWATWCGPCREELPRLDALSRRYSANPKIAFLAVNSEGEELASASRKANAFFRQMHCALPLAMSDSGTQKTLGVHVLPTLLILDPSGRVRLVHTGYDGAEHLESIIRDEVAALSR